MSTNPHGELFWGFPVDKEDVTRGDDSMFLSEASFYFEAKGIHVPQSKDYKSPEWDAWREKGKTVPGVVRLYGYGDEIKHFVAVKESFFDSEWGEMIKLPDGLAVKDHWRATLKEFCDVLGIPWREPAWHLTSLYF